MEKRCTIKPPTGTTMRAAMYHRYGGPEKLSVGSSPIPECGPADLLVQIHASTVNRTDCGYLRGKPWIIRLFSGVFKPRSQILGCEFAGVVVAIGDDVDGFIVGDRVTGFKDDDYGLGGHAEYTTIPASAMVAKIPLKTDYLTAAAMLEGAHYALMDISAADVRAGQSVLVNGGTGAIGSAAVQILKSLGARVVAVCGTSHLSTLRSLGADDVIDYQTDDFTHCGESFDLVFDSVGKSSYFKCRGLLKPGGVYISSEFGAYLQNPLLTIWTIKFGKHKVLFPLPENKQSDAEYLSQLVQDGHYNPLIDRVYSLDELQDAVRYVETGMKTGNVVIEIQ